MGSGKQPESIHHLVYIHACVRTKENPPNRRAQERHEADLGQTVHSLAAIPLHLDPGNS